MNKEMLSNMIEWYLKALADCKVDEESIAKSKEVLEDFIGVFDNYDFLVLSKLSDKPQ